MCANGAMHRQNRASWARKVHISRLLVVRLPCGLEKEMRHACVIGGKSAFYMNHLLEGLQQMLPMLVPEALVDPGHVVA